MRTRNPRYHFKDKRLIRVCESFLFRSSADRVELQDPAGFMQGLALRRTFYCMVQIANESRELLARGDDRYTLNSKH